MEEGEKAERKVFGNLFFNSTFCPWKWIRTGWRDTAVGEERPLYGGRGERIRGWVGWCRAELIANPLDYVSWMGISTSDDGRPSGNCCLLEQLFLLFSEIKKEAKNREARTMIRLSTLPLYIISRVVIRTMTDFFFTPLALPFPSNNRMIKFLKGIIRFAQVLTSINKRSTRWLTWKRLMSRGLPAFLRQFWLHFRKNLRKNLKAEGSGVKRLTRCLTLFNAENLIRTRTWLESKPEYCISQS